MSSIQSYGFLFNTTSNSNSSSFFTNSSSLLGDYSMIKSGAYKKLLTAYYKQQESTDSSEKTSSSSKTVTSSDEKAKLSSVKLNASTLKEAADALNKSSLYQTTGTDEDGNKVYDRDKINSAVKSYVTAYNTYVESSSKVDSTSVLSKTLSMVKSTASNKKLLQDIGITIGSDNKLVLDEEKLSKASVSTLSALFKGSGSYGNTVSQRASESYKLANSATYTGNSASYTYSGNYSVMGSTDNMLNQLL